MRAALIALLVAFPAGLLLWILQRAAAHVPEEPTLPAAVRPAGVDATVPPADASAPADDAIGDRLRSLLAAPLAGFRVDGELVLYDDKGLFDYIDGAAPTFLERGFARLAAVELALGESGEATCDVYDMGTPAGAAAIYAKERPASATWATLGDEGHRGARAVVFRRGRYYVKLTAFDDVAEAQLGELATLLVQRVDGSGAAPSLDAATADAATREEIATPATADPAALDAALRGLLRAPLDPARLDGEPVLYDDKGLFDYIDGAAPVFLERGFRKLVAAELRVGAEGELTCDVYDMASPDNAAAIYDKERPATATDEAIGDRAHRGARALVLRRGPYYIKLTAFDDEAEAALPALARTLVGRVP